MLASFWDDFLGYIAQEKEKNPVIYSLIKQLHPVELTEETIVLSCENQGFAYFLQKKISTIEQRLSSFLHKKIRVEIVVVPKKRAYEAPLLRFEPSIDDIFKRSGLSGKFAFDNFAVSSSNQVAYAASQAVTNNIGHAYNPLFLYGGVGVGKTHLAQAIARKILEADQDKKVLFSPGDLFTNELIESIREKTTTKFRKKYRKLDLLIIDDVQFVAGKNHVQEELFHTFNTVVSLGGQIILTSDRPPFEIKNLEDRLRSRFSGGLIVDIQAPDFELRTAILLIKAKEKNIEIDIEIAKIIAEQVVDTRSLEGTLLSIYAKTLGKTESIDLETVESFFAGNGSKEKNGQSKRLNLEDIIKTVCSYYNIKQSHLKGSNRSDNIALPRQVAMYLLRTELGLKHAEIAYLLKRKDHTTIIHGVGKINRLLIKDPVFKQELDRIRLSLREST